MAWAKLDDQFHTHRKARRAWKAHPRALGLHLLAMSYCADHLTDGFVDVEFVEEKLPRAVERQSVLRALTNSELWNPVDDGWQINDWLDFNPSRSEVEERREARAEAGRRGGIASGASRRGEPNAKQTPSKPEAGASASVEPPSRPVPDSSNDESSARSAQERNDNPEYARLSSLLADLIAENGSKRPTDAQVAKWRNDVRLMVEQDDRSVQAIEACIRWAQGHEFWRGVVLSMGAVREGWDKMRLQAQRDDAPRRGRNDRQGKVVALGGVQQCRRCDAGITNLQANNQSGLCDSCYGDHMARLEGESA